MRLISRAAALLHTRRENSENPPGDGWRPPGNRRLLYAADFTGHGSAADVYKRQG